MGINQRVSLRKFTEDIRRWVDEGKSDEWISSALGTTPSSVQSFRSRNGIYRREHSSIPGDMEDCTAYEGVVEPGERPGVWFDPAVRDDERWKSRWSHAERVEVRLSPERIVLVGRKPHSGI